jgi:hypothetical protein
MTDEPFYIVLAGFGRAGLEWVARDPKDATWERTVQALANGEWADVREVREVNPGAGTTTDITEKATLAAVMVLEGRPVELVGPSVAPA